MQFDVINYTGPFYKYVSHWGPAINVTVETGLSDFHAMIFTELNGGFVKKGPKTVYYGEF